MFGCYSCFGVWYIGCLGAHLGLLVIVFVLVCLIVDWCTGWLFCWYLWVWPWCCWGFGLGLACFALCFFGCCVLILCLVCCSTVFCCC